MKSEFTFTADTTDLTRVESNGVGGPIVKSAKSAWKGLRM